VIVIGRKMMGKNTEKSFRGLLLGLTGASMFLGLILLIVGAVVVSDYNVYLDFITGKYMESAVFILVMGVIVMTVSGIGFYAAFKFHYCMMTTFLSLMVVAVVCELIAAVTTFALNGEPSHQIGMRNMLKHSLEMYGSPSEPQETAAWDMIQTELKCCGLKDVNDYKYSNFTIKFGYLPRSCCGPLKIDLAKDLEKCKPETDSRHQEGCLAALKSVLRSKVGVVGAMAVVVAIFQITIIVGASVLVKKWKVPGHCYPCF